MHLAVARFGKTKTHKTHDAIFVYSIIALPSCKVAVDGSKITWCFYYHHCAPTEAHTVASQLENIVEVFHPIL